MPERSLPIRWTTAQIGDVCSLINGRAFKPSDWTPNGLPIVRIQNLNNIAAPLNRYNQRVESKFIIDSGELLFAWSGTPGTSFGAHIWDRGPAILNQHIFRVGFDERLLDKRYLRFAINDRLDHLIGVAHGGAGLAHVTKPIFEATEIIVPPLAEQRRIVADIDALTSRSRRAKEALDAIPPLLERFRQSVLAAAFRGDLTAGWREKNPDVEPAEELLKRIRAERRRRWEEAELAKLRAKGKVPGDDRWKDKYEEPEPVDASELPELPEGWCWTAIGETFNVSVGATPSRAEPSYWSGDISWVSSGEVAFCRISSTRERITELGLRNSSTELHPPGTVLLGMIGEGKTRGQTAILDIAACNNQNSAAIRVSETLMPPEYIYRYLEGEYERTRSGSSGNNQPALNKTRVQAIPFPLAPLEEQVEIVRQVELLLARADKLRVHVDCLHDELPALDRSILAKAFRGELVPQDPTDEPASVLLERLRAERTPVAAAAPNGRAKPQASNGKPARKPRKP